MTLKKRPIFTLGHSTNSLKAFVALLRQHEVAAVADVRSSPYSRFNPQFNRELLSEELKAQGIKYVFLGVSWVPEAKILHVMKKAGFSIRVWPRLPFFGRVLKG